MRARLKLLSIDGIRDVYGILEEQVPYFFKKTGCRRSQGGWIQDFAP